MSVETAAGVFDAAQRGLRFVQTHVAGTQSSLHPLIDPSVV